MSAINYWKMIKKELPELAKREGYTNFQMWMAYLRCYIIKRPHWVEFRINELYRLSSREVRNVVIEREISKVLKKFNPNVTQADLDAIEEKRPFNTTFRDFVKRDWLFLPDCSREDMIAFLEKNDAFLMKPYDGSKGHGIEVFRPGQYEPEEIVERFLGQSYMMEALICQHPAMSALNPTSVNTVRVVTARLEDRVMVVGGCLRVGKPGIHVDNFHSGGSAYPLDMEHGIVSGPGKTHRGDSGIFYSPATGEKVVGFEIPHWDLVIDSVSRAALLTGPVGYVGWDVAITQDGVDFVEANVPNPDPKVIQLDAKGVWDKLKRFN